MMRWTGALVITALALCAPANRCAGAILGFDDLSPNVAVPNGYGGLTWNEVFVHNREFSPSGYYNGVVSGTHAAYNVSENIATVMGSLFNFNSAYLTGAWNNGLNVRADGFVGATQIFTRTVQVNTSGPTLVNFNFVGVDRVVFTSFGGTLAPGVSGSGTHFVMDDFNYTIPEPASLLLACLAAGSLPLLRRRRSHRR
jgi:hypothetical protein